MLCRLLLMPLVGAAVLPHGALILDPTHELYHQKLNQAAREAGESLNSLDAELIVCVTPHGIQLENDFAVYTNSTAIGTAEWEGGWRDYAVNIDLGADLARSLLPKLKSDGIPAQGVACFSGPGTGKAVLRWGEVVPLWFLSRSPPKKFLIISLPSRRFNDLPGTSRDAERLGEFLNKWIASLPQKTLLVISGDLSHTHKETGPFGFNPAAAQFDSHVQKWAKNPREHEESLCVDAALLAREALSCGFVGMRLLNRFLQVSGFEYEHRMYHYAAPTYYGMLVATMIPKREEKQRKEFL